MIAGIVFLFDLRLAETGERGGHAWGLLDGSRGGAQFPTFDSIIALHDGPMVELKRQCLWETLCFA